MPLHSLPIPKIESKEELMKWRRNCRARYWQIARCGPRSLMTGLRARSAHLMNAPLHVTITMVEQFHTRNQYSHRATRGRLSRSTRTFSQLLKGQASH
ncbi:hypothetical protein J6590_057364 [Homalodisca vitripennis]|nr:hypothetical protein J6590_057364 [Homalodisca vitripennis]